MPLALTLALLAAGPTEAALADANTIAENGMLATIGPMQLGQEVEQMIAEHPELSDGEQASLREIGRKAASELTARGIAAEATAYAAHLSPEQLHAIAQFVQTDAARAQRAAMPLVIRDTMAAVSAGGPIDFGGTVRAAFCEETGKLCEPTE